ncbi:hypothetical protein AGMMS50225_19720 [Betaproteobacteria bacterium]|nr:hypothetical protein AGMMS50225_19720 [Betaproteobacteria bacterium]
MDRNVISLKLNFINRIPEENLPSAQLNIPGARIFLSASLQNFPSPARGRGETKVTPIFQTPFQAVLSPKDERP